MNIAQHHAAHRVNCPCMDDHDEDVCCDPRCPCRTCDLAYTDERWPPPI